MYDHLHGQSTDLHVHLQALQRIHVFMLSHANNYENYLSKLTDQKKKGAKCNPKLIKMS